MEEIYRQVRAPSACLECNQAIEILIDRSGIETIIRVEENWRRELDKKVKSDRELIRKLVDSAMDVVSHPAFTEGTLSFEKLPKGLYPRIKAMENVLKLAQEHLGK